MTYKRVIHDGRPHYGKHSMIRMQNCSSLVKDKEAIKSCIIALCDCIEMVRFGDPIVERFGNGIEIGISAVQLIETSAIVFHTNDGAKDLYADIFSCKDYDENAATECLLNHLGGRGTLIDISVVYRE